MVVRCASKLARLRTDSQRHLRLALAPDQIRHTSQFPRVLDHRQRSSSSTTSSGMRAAGGDYAPSGDGEGDALMTEDITLDDEEGEYEDPLGTRLAMMRV